jgi:hypothetical protein
MSQGRKQPPEKGPYTHRVEGGGDVPFHMIALEILRTSEAVAGTMPKRSEPPFATGGRTRETPEGKPAHSWDFDPANFRWTETPERLTVTNEGRSPVALVEIEVF